MGKLNIEISDEIHKLIKHKRIDTNKTNDEIISEALICYFKKY